MATKTVKVRNGIPDGTVLDVYAFEGALPQMRAGARPSGDTIDTQTVTNRQVTITANPGTYLLSGNLNAGVNEVQNVIVSATAGQFKLTFMGSQTADIAYNAAASAVQSALIALDTIVAGAVAVTGGPGDAGGTTPYAVTFIDHLGQANEPQLTAADGTTPLSGGTGVTVSTITPGSVPTGENAYLTVTVD